MLSDKEGNYKRFALKCMFHQNYISLKFLKKSHRRRFLGQGFMFLKRVDRWSFRSLLIFVLDFVAFLWFYSFIVLQPEYLSCLTAYMLWSIFEGWSSRLVGWSTYYLCPRLLRYYLWPRLLRYCLCPRLLRYTCSWTTLTIIVH